MNQKKNKRTVDPNALWNLMIKGLKDKHRVQHPDTPF